MTGYIYAQPLAVTLQQSVRNCANPCSLVFTATEQDMLYAFNANSNLQTAVWSLDLAEYLHTFAVNCSQYSNYGFCGTVASPGPFFGVYMGVTGTPAIHTKQ